MVKDASRKGELNLTDEVLQNMRFLELDGLVVIGDDDTQSFGAVLAAQGVPVWGIPETMDNDVPGTEYCLGFQTAIDRAAEFIGRIRSTAGSHRETILFRMFGRNAGFTALETAIVASVDRVLIPEVPADVDRLAELVAADRLRHPAPTSGAWRRSAQRARGEGFSVSGGNQRPASPSASRVYHLAGFAAGAFAARTK